MARALVVDDDAGTREKFARILQLDGHVVQLAATGADGLRLGLTLELDLILAELRVPDVDGLTLLKRLLDAGVHPPFVVVTGEPSTTTAFEAGRLGVAAYVEKPIHADELRRLVRLHARDSRVRESAEGHSSTSSPHTRLALRLIDERYRDPGFDIHVTAALCGITREHLARLIRDETGLTFTELLRRRRMSEARRLLAETPLRIKEIYQQVGVTSASEFDHAFKHTWHVSPRIYRLICRRETLRLPI
jgi:YesN/AraC family two-component response regulator